MQKRIVLINPPQNMRYPQPPMGLALLGAILEKGGYDIRIFDMNERGWTKSAKVSILRGYSRKMSALGITAMTPSINVALELIRQAKDANPRLLVMLGGVHATLLPEQTLEECPEIDLLVKGEGDHAISEAVRHELKGIYEEPRKVDIDSLPYLAYHLLPWREYRPHPPHGRALPFLPMITSRGCPYHCSYCSKAVFGQNFRAQSPERVVDEIRYMQKRFGVKEIAFYDDVFTLDKKRAYGIADEILKWDIKVCWTCETRANLVDRKLLNHMKKAGCYSIAYGIESASQDILDVIDKDISLDKQEEAVKLSQEAGLQTIGYFMIGSPNETADTIQETIKFAQHLKLDYAQFSVATPFPGTKLYEYYMDGKRDMDIPWESFVYAGVGNKVRPMFESNLLSRKDIEDWVSRAYREFYLRPSYVWQRLCRLRSVGDVKVGFKGLSMLLGNMGK